MFTKDRLKAGMFVKLRNKNLGVIVQDSIVLKNGAYTLVKDYDNDLRWRDIGYGEQNYDIVEVRGGGVQCVCFDNFDNMDLIYKRVLFTLDKIEDGDIVIVSYVGDSQSTFYKCKNLLLPVDSAGVAYNLEEFDIDMCLKSDKDVEITQVLRPCCEVEYAEWQRDVVKVVY